MEQKPLITNAYPTLETAVYAVDYFHKKGFETVILDVGTLEVTCY